MLTRAQVQSLITAALREDLGRGDQTTNAIVRPGAQIRAAILAKSSGIVAGATIAQGVFHTSDRRIRCRIHRRDGQSVRAGQAILSLRGPARTILTAERTALNILGHLSGIATLTHQFVQRVRPHPVKILDTRKTLPGLRLLEKAAVRAGGGYNHRMDLDEAVLIKTNHLKVLQKGEGSRGKGEGVIKEAVRKAKRAYGKFVEVEVSNLREFLEALQSNPDAILLDNWNLADIRKAVFLRNHSPYTHHPSPLLEVSGGVTLQNVRAIANTGVERISIGRLTHSAPALDVSLRVV